MIKKVWYRTSKFALEFEFLHHVKDPQSSIVVVAYDLNLIKHSVVCTNNEFANFFSSCVYVDQMANEWLVLDSKIGVFVGMIAELPEHLVDKWLLDDQLAGEWEQ